jgi:cell division protein ZapA (FtsZ GTPase activity inhibitor)
MNEKRILKLSIFNKEYVIMTDEKDEHIYSAARILDDMLRNIANNVNFTNEGKIAVLAALQLATDIVKQKEKKEASESKLSNLIDLLESNVAN